MTDRDLREAALGKLAIKTRERLDRLVLDCYLDDDRIQAVSTPDLVEACRRLEVSAWFPKFGELVAAAQAVRRERQERDAAASQRKRLAAYAGIPEVTPERARAILEAVWARIGYDPAKGMVK
jgi:hypothetical protein